MRVGLKFTAPVGGLDAANLYTSIYLGIKDALIQTGFVSVFDNVVTAGEEEYFDFIQAGATTDGFGDDMPRWMLTFVSWNPIAIYAQARHGGVEVRITEQIVGVSQELAGAFASQVWFACDGAEGWWWLAHINEDANQPSGRSLASLIVATPMRRYLVDTTSGVLARYGLFEAKPAADPVLIQRWMPPYAVDRSGTEWNDDTGWPNFDLMSPIAGMSLVAQRHPGSPVSQLVAPIFPMPRSDLLMSAAMLGELTAVMAISDGYIHGEAVVPGWIALVTGDPATTPAFALPAPDTFSETAL